MDGARSAGRRGRLRAIPGEQELRHGLLLLLRRGRRLLDSVASRGCCGREAHTRWQCHGVDSSALPIGAVLAVSSWPRGGRGGSMSMFQIPCGGWMYFLAHDPVLVRAALIVFSSSNQQGKRHGVLCFACFKGLCWSITVAEGVVCEILPPYSYLKV